MQFFDRAEIRGSARITRDGYLVADAMVGRANNIQEYSAAELGLTDRRPADVVRVFRPEKVVFDEATIASIAHRPVTLDHPPEAVTAANWKRYAVGDIGDEVMRDGDRIRVPIKVMDAEAVASIARDRQEFSLGYAATMDFTPGEFNGQTYDAALTSVSYNHLAACKAARGGSELRIVDERPDDRRKPTDALPVSSTTDRNLAQLGDQNVKKILLDGLQVDLSDASAVETAFTKLQGQLKDANDAKSTAETQVATLTTDKATLVAEKATLEKQLADAKLTPQQLRDAAASFAKVVEKAKALGVTATDSMDEPAIMKAVVEAKLGDTAKGWGAAQIAASFNTLTLNAPGSGQVSDSLRTVITNGVSNIGDARSIRDNARASRYAPAA